MVPFTGKQYLVAAGLCWETSLPLGSVESPLVGAAVTSLRPASTPG